MTGTVPVHQRVPRRTLGIRIRRVRGDFLLGDADRTMLLSGPAQFLFSSLDARRSVADVARLLAAEYGIDEEEALADTTDFLEDLVSRGIVEW